MSTGKKVASTEIKKPSHATIWVAKEFPPWQALVLNTLQSLHKESGGILPENSVIAARLKGEKSLGKYLKKVMPFVALLKVGGDTEWFCDSPTMSSTYFVVTT